MEKTILVRTWGLLLVYLASVGKESVSNAGSGLAQDADSIQDMMIGNIPGIDSNLLQIAKGRFHLTAVRSILVFL